MTGALALAVMACHRDPEPRDPVVADAPESPEPAWIAPDAPSPMRRLTAVQYDHTVRELFRGAPIPAVRFPEEPTDSAFDGTAEAQTPNPLYVEAVQQSAIAVTAAAMAADPVAWLGCPADGGPDPAGCGAAFVEGFGARAFRRPLTPTESDAFGAFFADELASGPFSAAVQLTAQAMLSSPQFLYRLEPVPDDAPAGWVRAPLDDYAVASRLSYLLWASMPDDALFAEAAAGELHTVEQIEASALRMLDDPRAADAVLDFHRQWLELDKVDTLNLNTDYYPQFSAAMNPSLRRDVEDVVLRVWDSDAPTLGALLHDSEADVDWALSIVYGVPEGPVDLGVTRAGLLTRPGWLAPKSHITTSSPVLRGVWVLERLLCTPPAPPPPDVTIDGGLLFGQTTGTNRDRYEQHTADPSCSACHAIIDPIGFGFEHYDALGTWRDTDNGYPVDATGLVWLEDGAVPFDGVGELSDLLSTDPVSLSCYGRHWFRFASGRAEGSADDGVLGPLLDEAIATGGDVRAILLALVRSESFRTLPVAP